MLRWRRLTFVSSSASVVGVRMMGGGDLGLGGLAVLPWLVVGLCALAVTIPLGIWVIRLLNETWFDPHRGEREWEEPGQAYCPDECPTQHGDTIQPDSAQGITPDRRRWSTRSAGGNPGGSAGR